MSDRRKLRKDPHNELPSKGSTHCFHCGAKLPEPELPTTAAPGTNEKTRVMKARAERRMPLQNPNDWGADSSVMNGNG